MREKLITLLDKTFAEQYEKRIFLTAKHTADFLLKNGVIVLPCQEDTILFRNGEKCKADHWNVTLTAFNEENHVRLFDVEEVENALKERLSDTE